MKLPAKLAIASLAIVTAATSASAQNATTDPVGFVTTNITASPDGVNYATSFISPVLLQASAVTGSSTGSLTGISANSVTVSGAGWVANELSSNLSYLLLKSGNATGMLLRITANTQDTATVDSFSADITTLGLAVGDSFQLIQGDTVLSMFGTPSDGVVGGNSTAFSASKTDRVVIRDLSGNLRSLYYNTDVGQWRRAGSSSDQGSIPISPYSGVYYQRIGTSPISMLTTGSVPVNSIKLLVPTSGSAFFARVYPTDGTLNGFGFQNLGGWTNTSQPGVTTANVDRVVTVDSSGNVRSFFYNGTQWRRAGSSSDQSASSIPVGGAVYTVRQGSGAAQVLSVNIPYSL